MSSKVLSWLIRFAVIACGLAGIFLCVYVYPVFCGLPMFVVTGNILSWIWLILIEAVTIPCYVILVFIWIVSIDVAKETVFSHKTAKLIGASAIIMLIATTLLLAGTVVLLAIESSFVFGYLLFVVVAAGFTLGVFAAVLARYVTKAALLKEENEGTI